MKHIEKLRRWSHDYLKMGYKPIPLRLAIDSEIDNTRKKIPDFGWGDDKKPRKWQNVIITEDNIDGIIDNYRATRLYGPPNAIALATGPEYNLFVVDLDHPLPRAQKWLKDNGIEIPRDAFCVRTQSGGLHYYFRFPEALKNYSSTLSKTFKDVPIDFRGKGGLIFAYPSVVYDRDATRQSGSLKKLEYTLHRRSGVDKFRMYDVPGPLVDMLVKRAKDREINVETNTSVNTKYCTKNLSDLSEKQRAWFDRAIAETNNTTDDQSRTDMQLMITAVKLGLSREFLLHHFVDVGKFARRHSEGKYFDYFNRTWERAISSVDMSKIQTRDPEVKKEQERGVLRRSEDWINEQIGSLTTLAMSKRDPERPIALCPNLIYRKYIHMIYAAASSGKSLLVYKMLSDASRCDGYILGNRYRFLKPPKTLLMQMDKPAAVAHHTYFSRIGLLECDNIGALHLDDFEQNIRLSNPAHKKLVSGIVKNLGVDLIVIDTLSDVVNNAADHEEAVSVMEWLKRLIIEQNAAAIVVAHARKEPSNPIPGKHIGLSDLYGAAHWGNSSQVAFGIEKARDQSGEYISNVFDIRLTKPGPINETEWENIRYRIIGEDPEPLSVEFEYTAPVTDSMREIMSNEDEVVNTSAVKANKTEKTRKKIIEILKSHSETQCTILRKECGVGQGLSLRLYQIVLGDLIKEGKVKSSGKTSKTTYSLTDRGMASTGVNALQKKIDEAAWEAKLRKKEELKASWLFDRRNIEALGMLKEELEKIRHGPVATVSNDDNTLDNCNGLCSIPQEDGGYKRCKHYDECNG